MANNWVVAGLATLAVILLSPKARQQLGQWIDDLAAASEQEARRKEAKRQSALLLEAISRIPLPPPATGTAGIVPKVHVSTEPDARLRQVITHPSVVLVLGKRGTGKSALGYRLLELFRYGARPYVVGVPASARKLLPEWIGIASSLEEVPPKSIALVDEATLPTTPVAAWPGRVRPCLSC